MPAATQFRAQTVIEAPIAAVFAFHENPANIRHISPGWQRIIGIEAQPHATVGATFLIQLRLFGCMDLRWEGIWREVRCPVLLVDEGVRCPFVEWRHEHQFEALDDRRTLLTDTVTFRMFALGWFGGLIDGTLGRAQFYLMFADRHARTRRCLREQMTAGLLAGADIRSDSV